MTKPRLSVVVPFYGVEDYIGPCLESIRVQTMQDIEVVLVDDGSLDGSRAIADEYVARDSRFRIVEQANAGIGEARNTGVRNVECDYFIFVDSDDMIARHGFDLMVSTIESTGSSFVVSNARRFSRTSGVRQSWTHQGVAHQAVKGTHILERPSLVRDRMLWNKVYRTSFYRDNGYTFPPIRYEDYPIAFEAHLDALSVDVVPSHCYYWRERESGDSITQQVFDYGNMLDRVVSAEMLLDLGDRKSSPVIRTELHKYLAEVDFVSLVQAFSAVDDASVPAVLDLCHRLVDRLRFDITQRPRLDQLQYHALKANDVELLRELAVFRRDGGMVGGVHTRRKLIRPWRFEAEFPGRGRSTAPHKVYEYPITALKLRSSVTDIRWQGSELALRGVAEITHLANGADSSFSLNLINGIDRIPLPVRRFDAFDQHAERTPVGFETRIDVAELASHHDLIWPLRFEIEMTVNGVKRVGLLRGVSPGSATYPRGRWLNPEQWIQPGAAAGSMFTLRQESDPVVLERVEAVDEALRLNGSIPGNCRRAVLEIDMREPQEDVRLVCTLTPQGETTAFSVELPAAAVLDRDFVDDPFTLASVRRINLATDLGDFPVLWTSYDRDVSVLHGDRLLTLTRAVYGAAVLHHTPPRPSTRQVEFIDGQVHVEGVWWDGSDPSQMTWRRYLPGTDDHVDVPATPVINADGTWSSRVALHQLLPPPEGHSAVAPGAADADWTLFVRTGEAEVPVAAEPAAIHSMPVETNAHDRWFSLTSIAGTTRTQVR